MVLVKKLIFGPLFLIIFTFLLFNLKPFLTSYDVIFALSVKSLTDLIILSFLITLTGFLFVLSGIFASSWKLILPASFVAAILPIVLLGSVGIVIAIGVLIVLLISFLNLQNKLKTYLNFEAASLFGPSIRQLTGYLIIIFSLGYFLSINKIISQNGFEVPDSIIDQALKLTPMDQVNTQEPQFSLSPEVLQQAGLDLSKTIQTSIKQTVKDQIQSLIKPYLGILPMILAVLFFFVLQSLTSLLNLLIYPLLWISFYIFEKTKFITFTEEQRTVRKMMV